MAANLTQILNFKANFHQEFELFSKKKFMLTMVDTLYSLSATGDTGRHPPLLRPCERRSKSTQ